MPEVVQKTLLNAVTANGDGPAVDIRNMTAFSVYLTADGGTSATVKFQGTADPAGRAGFVDLAYRQAGGGAYGVAADPLAAGDRNSYYFDPTDNVLWIRAVVAAQTGPTTITAYLTGEE